MRVKALTNKGEVVTLPSVDRCVEQFHIIGELAAEKGMLGRSNSVIDFCTLESGNPASDSYWENPDLYRRYTLPRGFKPKFKDFSASAAHQLQREIIDSDDLPALAISSPPSWTSSFDSDISFAGEDNFAYGLKRKTSLVNMGLKKLYYEPRVQQSLGDLYFGHLFSDPKKTVSLNNFYLREMYKEPIVRTPSLKNFCLKELFAEPKFGKSLTNFHLKVLFQECDAEASLDLYDDLNLLFKEQSSQQNKIKKFINKIIVRPLKTIGSAFARLNCSAGRRPQ